MKALLSINSYLIGLAVTFLAPALPADVISTTYPPGPAGAPYSYVPSVPAPALSVTTSNSNTVNVMLSAQAVMLKEMLLEHQNRAAEAQKNNQGEKAKWENELVTELQQRSKLLQKSIEESYQSGEQASKAKGDQNPELLFMSTVDERLAQIQRDLAAALADAQALSLQIATNKATETVADLSNTLGNNQRLVNELQKERFDLELRKLEFRALQRSSRGM